MRLEIRTHPLKATIHRAPLVGSLRNAKSLEGSHISVRVFGRYPPTDDVIFFVKCNDRRRRFDDTPPLFFFLSSTKASYPLSSAPAPSRLSTLPEGLVACSSLLLLLLLLLRPLPSLKICTVSCALLTASRVLTTLKLSEYIRASRVPRRNWYSFSALGTPHTRMTVPLSEAVARRVPGLFSASAEMGAL
jgi:hypothetical protein